MSRRTLILGGARSGKSRYAETLATAHLGQRVYIATAEAGDDEMKERVATHRLRRGGGWVTIEEPIRVLEILKRRDDPQSFMLFDCLTLWISNLMHVNLDVRAEVEALAGILPSLAARIVIVSNEVGLGIVPDNPLARRFRDEAGFANQRLAAACDEVVFMVSGLPWTLKG